MRGTFCVAQLVVNVLDQAAAGQAHSGAVIAAVAVSTAQTAATARAAFSATVQKPEAATATAQFAQKPLNGAKSTAAAAPRAVQKTRTVAQAARTSHGLTRGESLTRWHNRLCRGGYAVVVQTCSHFVAVSKLREQTVRAAQSVTAHRSVAAMQAQAARQKALVPTEPAAIAAAATASPAKLPIAAAVAAAVAHSAAIAACIAVRAAVTAAKCASQTFARAADLSDQTVRLPNRPVNAASVIFRISSIGNRRREGDPAGSIILRERLARDCVEMSERFARVGRKPAPRHHKT